MTLDVIKYIWWICVWLLVIFFVSCSQYEYPFGPKNVAATQVTGNLTPVEASAIIQAQALSDMETNDFIRTLGETATPRVQTVQVYDPYPTYSYYGHSY